MHGDVSFIEIGSSDTESSRPFFAKVFGWTYNPMPQGGGWFQTPSIRIGLHGGDTPQMYVFFEVPDLEHAIALVRDAGGEAEPPAKEEPGFGRFSFCRDPQGLRFGLHQQSAGTSTTES
jgi:predicted enzyme related to lactoylglutathione lyase